MKIEALLGWSLCLATTTWASAIDNFISGGKSNYCGICENHTLCKFQVSPIYHINVGT